MFFYGTYEGNELILGLENQILVEAKVENAGSVWGFFSSGNLKQSRHKKKREMSV